MSTDADSSRAYLKSLINRNLHIHVSDGRMFTGMFKCTDRERNIILSQAYEYREPSPSAIEAATAEHQRQGKEGNVKIDMTSRFMGLIVVPGQYITRIGLE